MSRYIHGAWTHISPEDGRELQSYIVVDREAGQVIEVFVRSRISEVKWEYVKASNTLHADYADAILNANSECLSDPEAYGLSESDSIPTRDEWMI